MCECEYNNIVARYYINIFNSKSAKIANYSIKRKFSKLTSNRIHPSIQVNNN